ncbi:D-alanyl-D-alanine carboxypeptidase family protein [Rhizobium sp. 9140]|uniref:D-alanyl-D-alanine carboxypeptidase family protein n=1 Tax=Rhizobium sp. 9140 TaxID=1761900 RepID=UPI000791AD67|nr:D-alanyl-D-alanine carboxypeptidase family protein [Rhizobium sp. 9140]CZT35207.1 D-alanyl-D-alanine carboxypeptidase (penicillin-binding protein 5/6) [Rhizobium sp. 9140]
MKRRTLGKTMALTIALALGSTTSGAQEFDTAARQALVIDALTETVLLEKAADEAVPPASMAKLMTVELVLSALKDGSLSRDTLFPVSEHAWRTGGAPSGTSTMFAGLNSRVSVGDLLQGVVVQYANDACIVLAEGMVGSEATFAERMTTRARAIGLKTSTFANPTGLPAEGNLTTMRDLVTLARHLRAAYPDDMPLFRQAEFEWNKIRQRNRNPLISANVGVDGYVTGFAEGYGYGIVASMERDGRRVDLALNGLATDKDRVAEARRVFDWAMTNFSEKRLFAEGETVAEASVYGGDRPAVGLVTAGPVDILLPVKSPAKLTARVVYRWPLTVPVRAGQVAGTLRIWNGEQLLREVPLKTAASVEAGSLTSRAADALQELLFFWL